MLTKKLCREIRNLDDMECEAMELMDRLAELKNATDRTALTAHLIKLHVLIFEMVYKTNDILEVATSLDLLYAPRVGAAPSTPRPAPPRR